VYSQHVSSVCFLDAFNHRHVGEDSLGDLLLAQLKVMIAQLKSDRVHVLGVLDSNSFLVKVDNAGKGNNLRAHNSLKPKRKEKEKKKRKKLSKFSEENGIIHLTWAS